MSSDFSSPLSRWLDRRAGRRPPRQRVNWAEHLRFWTSRESYNRRSLPAMLQLLIWLAVGVMAMVNLFVWVKHGGGWVSAASCATFTAVMLYPYLRHRIERGRWPD